jgi:hypothetical protein
MCREIEGKFGEIEQLSGRHATIDPGRLIRKGKTAVAEFTNEVKNRRAEQFDIGLEDQLRDKIDQLVSGKVGRPVSSQNELDEISTEGKERYDRRCPPGYMDSDKGTKGSGDRSYLHYNGLIIRREFGDLLLWLQIIEEAKTRKADKVLFITDDEKEDWWWVIDSRGKKTLGPRPELGDEIRLKGGVRLFYMYNSERFMEFARHYLGAEIEDASIRGVEETKEALRTEARSVDQILAVCSAMLNEGFTFPEAVDHVAAARGIHRNTVRDKCTRGLSLSVSEFKTLVQDMSGLVERLVAKFPDQESTIQESLWVYATDSVL